MSCESTSTYAAQTSRTSRSAAALHRAAPLLLPFPPSSTSRCRAGPDRLRRPSPHGTTPGSARRARHCSLRTQHRFHFVFCHVITYPDHPLMTMCGSVRRARICNFHTQCTFHCVFCFDICRSHPLAPTRGTAPGAHNHTLHEP
jgi:hypothetical protein